MPLYIFICILMNTFMFMNPCTYIVTLEAPEDFQRNNFHYFMMTHISISFSLFYF